MIINITAKLDESGLLQYDIPSLHFDRRFNYKIGVTHINYQLLNTKPQNNELLCLNTNLVDLSVHNANQTILHFPFDFGSIVQNIKVPIVVHHNLQLYEFENASFVFHRFFENDVLELKNIFIQLEVLRLDAYGRIQ